MKDCCRDAARALGDATPVYEPAASFREYDIVSGRAGKAISFAYSLGAESARISCDYLAWLVQDYRRWRCTHPRVSDAGPVNDLGIAHGLAGMLAALALSAPFEPKYSEALAVGLGYLCRQREQTSPMGWSNSVPPRGSNGSLRVVLWNSRLRDGALAGRKAARYERTRSRRSGRATAFDCATDRAMEHVRPCSLPRAYGKRFDLCSCSSRN